MIVEAGCPIARGSTVEFGIIGYEGSLVTSALVICVTGQRLGQPPDTPHGYAVVFVSRPTNDTYLIVLSMRAVGPGEAVRAQFLEEERKKPVCHSLWAPHLTLVRGQKNRLMRRKIAGFY
jgi:hypothetical protein